ncbi:DUF3530 family protein [Marinobacterium arenosum]|uniref:DUF3530 family protein n=1 Tax=Marinobacterium arenosum TaxID=2862496 RepID=UPI001C968249|nr:DUF3530 family protein [Marinobacterium arenosum]MBY4676082.1 alpha/beta hydrolase family protein [Marinobacterium arenosum]
MIKPLPFIPLLLSLLVALPAAAADGDAEPAPTEQTAPAAAPAEPPRPPRPRSEPDPDAAKVAELAKALEPRTQVLWLPIGEIPALALYQPQGSGQLHGSVILFHDDQTHADWPNLVRPLRLGLADKGWDTLSLQLPKPPHTPLPKRTLPSQSSLKPTAGENDGDGADPAEAGDNDSAVAMPSSTAAATEPPVSEPPPPPGPSYDQRVMDAGNAAVAQLQQNPGRLVILGIGSGAVWAAAFAMQLDEALEADLVMVDARQPQHPDVPDLMMLLPQLRGTVLDLYHGEPLADDRQPTSPAERQRLARREKLTNYHQSRMPLQPDNWKQRNKWILSRVRGYMTRYLLEAEKNGARPKPRMDEQPKMELGPGQARKPAI